MKYNEIGFSGLQEFAGFVDEAFKEYQQTTQYKFNAAMEKVYKDDPKEERNIAEKHPEIVARMTTELHAWQRSVERSLSGADY